jgi:hypothetical protein
MPVPVRSYMLGAHSSIVILLLTMPVPVQAFWQCPYRYWHFCQLCQYQYGHFTYANTKRVVHRILFWHCLCSAGPVLVLVLYRVVYRGVTSSFFGIGILPVSDLLDFRYFGRYRSPPFFVYFPPFFPPFFQKGLLKKGAIAPLLRKKGGTAPFFIPKCTDRIFLRYRYG